MSLRKSVLARIVWNLDLLVVLLVGFATIGFATAEILHLWKIEKLQPQAVPTSQIEIWAGIDHRHAYYFLLPPAYQVLRPDSMTAVQSSRLFLSEDGAILPLRHVAHAEINELGSGRYSHWGNYVVFSASDNTDPRSNGRTYTIRAEQGRPNYVHLASAALSLAALGCCLVVGVGMVLRRRVRKTADALRLRLIHPLAALAVSALALCMLTSDWATLTFGHQVATGEPQPDGDRTFVAEISPGPAGEGRLPEFFLVDARTSPFPEAIDAALGDSYVYGWFKALYRGRFPLATSDGWRRLTPIRATPDDVRHGDARYTIQAGSAYFRLPDDMQVGSLKRVVAVASPIAMLLPGSSAPIPLVAAIAAASILILAAVIYFIQSGPGAKVVRSRIMRATVENLAPGLAISAILAFVVAGGTEIYFRAFDMFPVSRVVWPGRAIPGVGITFAPGAEVRWTNGVDYWTTQRTNSLGFLDAEPTTPKPPGTFRIVLVGDSFVEAAQVPIKQKLQTLLAQKLKSEFSNRSFEVLGFGHSGIGQSQELALFEYFEKILAPDLVVLVIVNNDLANNSVLLESIRSGWDPHHPPLLFFERKDGQCKRLPVSRNGLLAAGPVGDMVVRAKAFKESADFGAKLRGWDPNQAPLMDFVFYDPGPLPPAFEDAVEATHCAFAAWKDLAQRQGFGLVAVATENVNSQSISEGSTQAGQIERYGKMLADLGIPLLDLYTANLPLGNMHSAVFSHDGHWSPEGHRRAAQALFDLLRSGEYLKRSDAAPTASRQRPANVELHPNLQGKDE